MIASTSWSIAGAAGEPIRGNAHVPGEPPRGVVLLAHGFKGYKDYGMFPCLAARLAEAGFIAHRFNFSHSGMTNDLATFARPDLFERDTWNKQVFDLRAVIQAVAKRELEGAGLPLALFGHSRGGVTVLLAAGRHVDDRQLRQPRCIITAAAPDTCNSFSEGEKRDLLTLGFIESPSARTGQALRVGRIFIDEQLTDPQGHDLLTIASRIDCPVLIVHGDSDTTVPVSCADRLADAVGVKVRVLIIPGADHVFNTANPLPPDAPASEALNKLIDAMVAFASSACSAAPVLRC